ncbi:hypothetical protein ACM66B_002826 [Microbotryomycetes sp. NB124-2]
MLVHSVSQHAHALSDAADNLRSSHPTQQELLRTDMHDLSKQRTTDRPLEAVNRHSRQVDMSPTLSATEGRRVSRLPSNLGSLDPFGYDLDTQTTPYDSAYAFTHPSTTPAGTAPSMVRNNSRNSTLYSPVASTSSPHLAQQTSLPGSTSMLSVMSAATTATAGPSSRSSLHAHQQQQYGNGARPWMKPRSASWGDPTAAGRTQFKNGLSAPNNRSKLSGEIVAETMSVVELPVSTPKIDYTSSRLYQRTLKAQKALEKDRAKAAARGKVSKYDTPDLKTLAKQERRQSAASSFVSDVGVMANRSRSSLGWFRSSSEATLALPPSPTLQPGTGVSSSRSSTTLLSFNSAKGSPHLELPPATTMPTQKLKTVASQDRLREAREAVGAVSPPRQPVSRRASQQPPTSSGIAAADVPVDRSELRPRQSSLMPTSSALNGNATQLSRTPSPLSMAEVSDALMKSPRTDSAYVSCSSSKEPSLDHDQRPDGSPSPPSSESSPSTPPSASIEVFAPPTDLGRPALPRSRKSSFNLFGKKTNEAAAPTTLHVTSQPASKMTKSRSSFFGRSSKSSAPAALVSAPAAPLPAMPLPTRVAEESKLPPSPARLTKSKSGFGSWFGGRARSKTNPDAHSGRGGRLTTEKDLPPPPPPPSNRLFAAAVLRRG